MKNRVKSGTLRTRSGTAVIVSGFLVAVIIGYLDAREIDVPFAARLVSLVMIVGGAFLSWRDRQYRAQATAQSMIGDSKSDVLYLRAFETDSSVLRFVGWSFLLPRLIASAVTEEEPRTISKASRVTKAIHACGSKIHSIEFPLLRSRCFHALTPRMGAAEGACVTIMMPENTIAYEKFGETGGDIARSDREEALLPARGIECVGPLPPEVQRITGSRPASS